MLFGSGSEEDCLDLKAFEERDWPADRVIKMLAAIGHWVEELEIDSALYDAVEEQLGSKFRIEFASPFGMTRLKRVKKCVDSE